MTSKELLLKRDGLLNQVSDAGQPVVKDEAIRYLNQYAGGFEPLLKERRNIMAQSEQVLPSQISDYIDSRNMGGQGASPLTQLSSIFKNQANVRGQSDLIGDQINMARGNISNIASSAIQQTGQKQDQLKMLLGYAQNDYDKALQSEEQEKLKKEALAQQARLRAQYQYSQPVVRQSQPVSRGATSISLPTQEQITVETKDPDWFKGITDWFKPNDVQKNLQTWLGGWGGTSNDTPRA